MRVMGVTRPVAFAEPASGRFGPWQILAYSAGNAAAGLVFAFMNAAMPLYLGRYGFPNWAIGLLSQERPPFAGLLQIVVGVLSDRTRTRLGRRRPYILAGIPVVAVALLALALQPPAILVVLLLLVMTSFLAIGYGPFITLLVDLVPAERRGRVSSALNIGNMAGQMLMLWLASTLWVQHEPLVFVIVASGLLVGFGLTVVGVRERATTRSIGDPAASTSAPSAAGDSRHGHHGDPEATATGGPAIHASGPRPAEYARSVLRHREAMKYLFATLFFWLGTGSVVPFLTRFGVQELGTDEATAFRLLLIPLGATAVVSLPAGWIGDRLGKKRVVLAGFVAMGVSVVVGSQVQTVEQAAAALVVTGAANALCTVLLFPLLADLIPRERAGEFSGIGSAAWELAQPVGAVLGGLAADVTGSLRTTLVVAGLLVLVAGALLVPVRTARTVAPEYA